MQGGGGYQHTGVRVAVKRIKGVTSAAADSEKQKKQRVTDRNGKQENTCATLAGSGEGPEDGLELRLPGQTQRTSEPAGT